MRIYPVIHYLNPNLALEQVAVARRCGADGVFLISHHGDDDELVEVAARAKRQHPDFRVGINLLSQDAVYACHRADAFGLDMVWADDMGVDSRGGNAMADSLALFARTHPAIQLFASVAFKYRPHEPDPPLAAIRAQRLGFVPTTSGSATGHAPEVRKIADMSVATGGQLAIASGMTAENVRDYASYLSDLLVATGVGLDDYRMDPKRLLMLIANSKGFFGQTEPPIQARKTDIREMQKVQKSQPETAK